MKTEDITHGLEQLDQLAQGDYHRPLSDLVASGSPEEVFSRVSRLIGVTMKQPFAEPHDLGRKSEFTGSYREWELVPNRFDDPAVRGTWQYQTLEALLRERPDGPQIESVSKLGQFLQYETGFFGYLARAAQGYICNDPNLRKKIDKSIAEAEASGFDVKHLRPETLVGAGAQALGSLLVEHIKWLAVVGAPVITGFVLLLYAVGADAFCKFMQGPDKEK